MDIIIQGPTSFFREKKYTDFLLGLCENVSVEKIIISTTNNFDCTFPNAKIQSSIYPDPGADIGNFSKPLNLKRYFYGVRNALKATNSDDVLIIRSDIIFDLGKLLSIYKQQDGVTYITDVTTKSQFIKDSWDGHFCDWMYAAKRDVLIDVFENYDYDNIISNMPISKGSIYPLSPERFIKRKIDETTNLKYELIPNQSISMMCLKEGYEKIPFGINKKYMIAEFEFKYLRRFSKNKVIRLILKPILKIYYNVFR
ncbi:hypothetical protein HYO42_15950 [Vibrio parahaemolyticus]|nr:hypothetical protein [Vibrio parahaemolyticus]MBM4866719.1 hypothetical protein [Vibrio parahaemolyticus]MBM4885989.1 hypothetical protein [Vibrio parahaemolyticus]